MVDKDHLNIAILRAAIVLVPSYLMAYFTDKMVYVIPTLAAAGFFAAALKFQENKTSARIDEDGADGGNAGGFNPLDLDGSS